MADDGVIGLRSGIATVAPDLPSLLAGDRSCPTGGAVDIAVVLVIRDPRVTLLARPEGVDIDFVREAARRLRCVEFPVPVRVVGHRHSMPLIREAPGRIECAGFPGAVGISISSW